MHAVPKPSRVDELGCVDVMGTIKGPPIAVDDIVARASSLQLPVRCSDGLQPIRKVIRTGFRLNWNPCRTSIQNILIDLIRIQIHTVPGPESGKGYLTVRPALAIPFSRVAGHNCNSHQ